MVCIFQKNVVGGGGGEGVYSGLKSISVMQLILTASCMLPNVVRRIIVINC